MTLRMLRRFVWILVAVVACTSPTLPLPPPALPEMTLLSDNHVYLHSTRGVEPDAVVVIFNRDPTLPLADRVEATLADGEGTWGETVVASPGDVLDIHQEFGTMSSPTVTFRVPTK